MKHILFCIEPNLTFFTSDGLVSAFGYHVPFAKQTFFTSDLQKETATPKGIKGLSRPKISLRPLSGNVMKGIVVEQYECVWLDATSYSFVISRTYKCELTLI